MTTEDNSVIIQPCKQPHTHHKLLTVHTSILVLRSSAGIKSLVGNFISVLALEGTVADPLDSSSTLHTSSFAVGSDICLRDLISHISR